MQSNCLCVNITGLSRFRENVGLKSARVSKEFVWMKREKKLTLISPAICFKDRVIITP